MGPESDPCIKKQRWKQMGEKEKRLDSVGEVFMSDSQDKVQAKNTLYDDPTQSQLCFSPARTQA